MALVLSKHIEIKANVSIRKFLDEAKKTVDGQILNQITGKTVFIKAGPSEKMKNLGLYNIFSALKGTSQEKTPNFLGVFSLLLLGCI